MTKAMEANKNSRACYGQYHSLNYTKLSLTATSVAESETSAEMSRLPSLSCAAVLSAEETSKSSDRV